MENLRRWINYDWFKLIILLILLLLLIYWQMQPSQAAIIPPAASPTISSAVSQAATPASPPAATLEQPTATLPPAASPVPSDTLQPTPSPAPAATATLEPTPAATPEATLEPTPAPTLEPTATQAVAQPTEAQPDAGDCAKALPSRLDVGQKAKVLTNLYLRQEAGIDKTILMTNLPGTQLEIIGGPVCIPYNQGVYRWWNVKTAAEKTGWSAEGSASGKNYFLQPVP